MLTAVQELRLSDSLSLPAESVTQTFAILAKRGMGKTYTGSVLAEEMLKAGLQIVVYDPVGVWWGLRAAADGEGPGLPIVILGGRRADLPLDPGAGETVAELVVQERLSVVLDVSELRKGEQTRFMTDFAEALYRKNRAPLHLFLDEADAVAPQRPMPGEQRMLGAIEDLVRRGRARGLGVTLITQRPAVLNKNVLTQVEVLVCLRLIAPQDRQAVDEWVKVHAEGDERQEFLGSLPSLEVGEAWFWSPGWLDLFRRLRVRRRETFDSSSTPKAGALTITPRELAAVDLEALRARLTASMEADPEDADALKRRVRQLEEALADAAGGPSVRAELEQARAETAALRNSLAATRRSLLRLAAGLAGEPPEPVEPLAILEPGPLMVIDGSRAPLFPDSESGPVSRGETVRTPEPETPPKEDRGENGALSTPQQRILDALAEFETLGVQQPTKANVAVWAEASPTSSSYGNNLGRLRSLGLIDYPTGGKVALTASGRAKARPTQRVLTLEELHAAWLRRLSGPQARIMRALLEKYPQAVTRSWLAERAGASETSSSYGNNLGALRSLGLLDYPLGGHVVATRLLFPEILCGGRR